MTDQRSFSMTPEMVDYTLGQLAQRAGLTGVDSLGSFKHQTGLSLSYGFPEDKQVHLPRIVIQRCPDEAWGSLLSAPAGRLAWVPVEQAGPPESKLTLTGTIPVLFWGAGGEDGDLPFVEQRPDGGIRFNADIIAGTFFMLSRWEEMVVPTRDEHDRFPASASVACKQQFLRQPIVDQYAVFFGAWVKHLLPTIDIQTPTFSIKLSHDIDKIEKQPSSRKDPDEKLPHPDDIESVPSHESDPYLAGIMKLAALSEKYQFHSTFYFMTADDGKEDRGYIDRADLLRNVFDTLQDHGHEIGFHAGYETYDNPEIFFSEKARMDELLGHTHYGGRQHFLRFHIPDTWRLWEQAGLAYDSTLGYENRYGFRCGTCHPYHPFDIPNNRKMDILEIPLVVMGFTLNEMRDYSPEESADRILSLATRCQEVNGVFTLLWHNTSFGDEWQPYVEKYRALLPVLKTMEDAG